MPLVSEVFGNQSSMAMIRSVFAAKQYWARTERVWVDPVFDLPLDHQVDEPILVLGPVDLLALVFLQEFLGRCEQRQMLVLGAA